MLDGDERGREGAKLAGGYLAKRHPDVRIADPGDGLDPKHLDGRAIGKALRNAVKADPEAWMGVPT